MSSRTGWVLLSLMLPGCLLDTGLEEVDGTPEEEPPVEDTDVSDTSDTGHEDWEVPSAETAAAWFEEGFSLGIDRVWWGEIDVRTSYAGDACGGTPALTPGQALEYARETGLDWVGLADPSEALLSPVGEGTAWDATLADMALYNQEELGARPLVVFPAFRYERPYQGEQDLGYGTFAVVFSSLEDAPALPVGSSPVLPEGAFAADTSDLWEALAPYAPTCDGCAASAMAIPVTPAMVGSTEFGIPDQHADLTVLDPDFVRGTHLATRWGVEEGMVRLEMECPDLAIGYAGHAVSESDTMRTWLYDRWVVAGDETANLGFWGGSDSLTGHPGDTAPAECGQADTASVTGVAAPTRAREDLWDGLWSRAVVTSQADLKAGVLFGIETAGEPLLMGQSGAHDGTAHVYAVADASITVLELVVDGCVVSTASRGFIDAEIELSEGRHFVYVRGATDGSMDFAKWTWTSPVFLGEPTGG